ncbi:MAG: sugar ABC transporter permease [Anaerolineaceae bacterium]|nr:sugar ABC transporter permease [Anaerolineaceae bacterium]
MNTISSEMTGSGLPAVETPRAHRPRLTSAEHKRLSRIYKLKRALTGYAFIAPNFIFFFVFLLIPMVWVFWFSLNEGGILGPSEFVGLQNWKEAFKDPLALQALKNSVLYGVIAIPGMLILGMVVALFLRNIKKGSAVMRAGIYFPVLAPTVVAGLIWVFIVHPDFGALNLVIRAFTGKPLNFLGTTTLALPTVAAVEIWRGVGFWAVYFLAALVGLPAELYQAAHLDGSNGWQRFYHLTLPLLRPTILFAIVQATIYNLQIFDSVFVMTDGGPSNSTATIVWYIYRTLFTYGNVGYGAALSFALLIVILAFTLIQMRLLRRRR